MSIIPRFEGSTKDWLCLNLLDYKSSEATRANLRLDRMDASKNVFDRANRTSTLQYQGVR
jgi:hypothetical protein